MKNGICLEAKGLKKHFGAIKAVDGLNLKVKEGCIFGMLGPNGAGKSTTIELLIGLQARDSGAINILGLDPSRDREELKERVGVQLQSPALFSKLKVKELVSLFASFYREPLPVDEVISMVDLGDKAKERTEALSGGQRHRLAVALAVVGNGDMIFLDEPTTGLDPQSRRQLHEVMIDLKGRGKTLFITTHYMDEAEKLCDDLVIIDEGKVIAQGNPKDLMEEHFEEDALEFINPSFTEEELGALGGLSHVIRQRAGADGLIILYTNEAPKTMEDLMAYAKRKGKSLAGLNVRRPTLEDLFLKLTGRKIRK